MLDYAVREFGLPEELKLSVHSGSDKFSIYPIMGQLIKKYDKGLHVKTAGTTWLEEVIGLAMAGGPALDLVKQVYAKALKQREKLCAPYADVIDIDPDMLPSEEEVNGWSSEKYVNTLRRQLIHVGYKIAVEFGHTYTGLLEQHADIIGNCVEENIFDRHLKRLFDL